MNGELDLSLLRTFVAVRERGSVTAAARHVGRTQSAVSQQLQRLEASVGRRLLFREGRRPTLTPEGELLLRYARDMLALSDEARRRLRGGGVSGRVRFGVPDLYAAYLLPEVLASFARAYPRVEIDLRCAMSSRLLAALEAREIDLALVTGRGAAGRGGAGDGERDVRREPLVWVAAEGARPEEHDVLPLAMLPPGAHYRDLALAALDGIGRPWRIVCVSESIAGLQTAVFAGLAVSVVARCAVSPGMRVLAANAKRLPALPAIFLKLHYRPSPDQPALQRLADHVRGEIGNLAG
ncbi:MAG: LysR family transcriptional regulator [Geminicoccaceae bacterium]|nr:LysR family transcriptional regulator [Geminicoccaceae bacterium]